MKVETLELKVVMTVNDKLEREPDRYTLVVNLDNEKRELEFGPHFKEALQAFINRTW